MLVRSVSRACRVVLLAYFQVREARPSSCGIFVFDLYHCGVDSLRLCTVMGVWTGWKSLLGVCMRCAGANSGGH